MIKAEHGNESLLRESAGFYTGAGDRCSHFYWTADQEDVLATLYHEVTHQLFAETKRALRRGLENPVDKQVWVDETRDAAIDILEYRGFTLDELKDLWRERGEDYFLRERPEDIAWHTEAIDGHHDRSKPLVLARSSTDSNVANTTQIFIHARSNATLFSRICAELEQLDLSSLPLVQ